MSVLSCGDALSLELSFESKSLSGALPALNRMLHQRTCGRSNHQSGSVPAPRHPMTKEPSAPFGNLDQKGEVSSPFMDFPSTKRSFHSPLEPSIISLRPTVRRLDAVSVSKLKHYQGFPLDTKIGWKTRKNGYPYVYPSGTIPS